MCYMWQFLQSLSRSLTAKLSVRPGAGLFSWQWVGECVHMGDGNQGLDGAQCCHLGKPWAAWAFNGRGQSPELIMWFLFFRSGTWLQYWK